jgi:uncharacterized protein (TIGR03435 family)
MSTQIFLALLLVAAIQCSAGDDLPKFEIATLKLAPPPGESYQINLGTVRSGRLNLTNVTLGDCIKFAYGLVSDDQISGPEWIKSKTVLFDIVAEVPPDTPREKLLLMTEALLSDRLKLVLHREKRELRYLALVVGKNGPKMQRSIDESPQSRDNSAGHGRVTGNQVPMPLLASFLSRSEHEIVVDATGLTGSFQVKLQWKPGTAGSPTAVADDDPDGASLYTAINEQLGLQLRSRKGPLDILVVDQAEKTPAAN